MLCRAGLGNWRKTLTVGFENTPIPMPECRISTSQERKLPFRNLKTCRIRLFRMRDQTVFAREMKDFRQTLVKPLAATRIRNYLRRHWQERLLFTCKPARCQEGPISGARQILACSARLAISRNTRAPAFQIRPRHYEPSSLAISIRHLSALSLIVLSA